MENVSEVRHLVALQHIDERSQLVVERDFLAKAFELVSISRASFCRRPAGESEENLALMQLFDETDDHRQTRTDQGL